MNFGRGGGGHRRPFYRAWQHHQEQGEEHILRLNVDEVRENLHRITLQLRDAEHNQHRLESTLHNLRRITRQLDCQRQTLEHQRTQISLTLFATELVASDRVQEQVPGYADRMEAARNRLRQMEDALYAQMRQGPLTPREDEEFGREVNSGVENVGRRLFPRSAEQQDGNNAENGENNN